MKTLLAIIAALALAACGSVERNLNPFRPDIQQGNVVNQDMVAKLKPGMTKSQVRFILGTPLVTDVFHADRWDYVYRQTSGSKVVEQRRLIAVFENEKLARLEGDVTPSEGAAEASGGAAKPATGEGSGSEASPTPREKSLFDRMLETFGLGDKK